MIEIEIKSYLSDPRDPRRAFAVDARLRLAA